MDTARARCNTGETAAARSGLEYPDLDGASVEDEVFGHRVRFCGLDHLVAMKEAAGRPEDEIDLKRLRESRGDGS